MDHWTGFLAFNQVVRYRVNRKYCLTSLFEYVLMAKEDMRKCVLSEDMVQLDPITQLWCVNHKLSWQIKSPEN